MKPVQVAFLCVAMMFGGGAMFAQGGFGPGQQGVQQGGFRGVQRGFGNAQGGQRSAGMPGGQGQGTTRQSGFGPGQQGARQGGFGGPQGGFGPGQQGGPQGGFGGPQGGFGPGQQGAMQGGFGGGWPRQPASETKLKRPFGAGQFDTSAFMAGEIHVNLVLFECNGKIDARTETWSKDEIAKVIAHVENACSWWEEMWKKKNYIGELHFTIDLEHANTPFQTSYEPIAHGAYRDDRLWIGEFLNAQGYSGDKTRMLYRYTADTIEKHNADFAFNIFVVKADNDRDHYFSDNYRSYTLGRQRDGVSDTYILTAYSRPYDWYSSQSFAHEMAHIFGAADEYPGQGSYNERAGYYGVQNTNAPDGNPNRKSIVPSLMNSSISTAFERRTTSPQSLEMVGWRDSDGDGVIDVLDAPIEVADFTSKLKLSDSTYDFRGTFTVQKIPNYNNTKAITINSVDRLLYRFGESGEWKSDNDKDWKEESRTVSHKFKIPANSVLQWKVVDSSGTTESKTYTIGNVRNPKVGIDREKRSARFSFTPATADTGIVRYRIRVDEKVYDVAEQPFTLSGIPSGRHAWAIQGVYADSSATDWLSCGSFSMPSQASQP